MDGSSFEHDRFYTRPSFEDCRQQLSTNGYSTVSWAIEQPAGPAPDTGTNTARLSLNQLEKQSGSDGKAEAGAEYGDSENFSSVGTLTPNHTWKRSIQPREKPFSLLASHRVDGFHAGPDCVRIVHLAALQKHSMRDWNEILAPPGLASSAATHILLAPWSSGVGLQKRTLVGGPDCEKHCARSSDHQLIQRP